MACTGKWFFNVQAMSSVRVSGISKRYGNKTALDSVDLDVGDGELFGIIGPDGAGKTTLFRIMVTLLVPDSGKVTVAGFDTVSGYAEIRKRVGYMPGRFSLYQDLTVEENLRLFASVFETTLEENYHLVEDIYRQIEPFRKRRAGKLSGGMKQKLALCCAMIHKPEVLFLDEPTTGVDPVSRKEFWQMLRKLKDQGITIIVSTPYMDEAAMCDRISLMNEGRFLMTASPADIVSGFGSGLLSIAADDKLEAMRRLERLDGVLDCYFFGETLHAVIGSGLPVSSVSEALSGLRNVTVETAVPTVEDCFLELNRK